MPLYNRFKLLYQISNYFLVKTLIDTTYTLDIRAEKRQINSILQFFNRFSKPTTCSKFINCQE